MGGGLLFLIAGTVIFTVVVGLGIVAVMALVAGRKGRLAELDRLDRELDELERRKSARDA
ncbi:MAG TPA: hypothetical protein PKN27_05030 [Propionibacteriaceae bacterium]|nr:hypothetical protein [Propionibacteriaceae bacterium]